MREKQILLNEVEAYLRLSGMSATAFGDASLGDRHFVRQLRGDRRCWPETVEKVRKWMLANPPVAQAKGAA